MPPTEHYIDAPTLSHRGEEQIWEQIEQVLADHQRFLLTTHVNPDGDGLGSEIALALHLADMGKDVTILNTSPVSPEFAFLESEQARVEVYVKEINHQRVLTSDVIVILDTAEWSRLGPIRQAIQSANGKLVVIDHHICHRQIGDVFLSVPEACSTGELVFRLLRRSRRQLNLEISRALFVALATDTGWFRFNNTDADTLFIASQLLANGVSPAEIYQTIYENTSWEDVGLFREMVARMRGELDQMLVTVELPQEVLSRYDGLDTDPILDYALSIPATEVVLLFKQLGPDSTKVSFRSRGTVDVGSIAQSQGGGGHRCAAGAVTNSPMSQIRSDLLGVVRQHLVRHGMLTGTE